MFKKHAALITLMCVASLNAYAASEDSIWANEIEVGANYSTGNTEETNLTLRGEAIRSGEVYKQTFQLDVENGSQNDRTTEESFYFVYRLDRSLSENSTIFGRFGYEDDRFSGYEYRVDLVGGYSRDFIKNEVHALTGSLGLGFRESELDTGDTEDEVIVTLEGNYVWNISANAVFKQVLRSEIGDFQTVSRSESSLTSNILDDLALRFAFNVKHTSEVPAGRDKTDTETSMTMLYKF